MGWMKKSKHQNPDVATADVPARKFSIERAILRFMFKVLLLVAIIYAGLQILVRTDFFQSRVEDELSRLAGMEVRVGRIRAAESLNLRIHDAVGVSDVAGIEVHYARLRWRFFRPWGTPMLQSLRVDGMSLTIAPDAQGVLQPRFLGALSQKLFEGIGIPMPQAAQTAGAKTSGGSERGGKELRPPFEWLQGPMILRGVNIRWNDDEGNLLASVNGLDLMWSTMVTPNGGRVSHVECRAAEINIVKGPKINGLHLELVEADGKRFLVALNAVDWGTAPQPRDPAAKVRALFDAMD